MKLFLLFVNLFMLTACSTIIKQDYYYNEIVLRNNLPRAVTDVKIKVEKTQAVFSCGYILSGTACSTKFPKRKYLGNEIHVTWTYNNYKQTPEKFVLKVPKGMDTINPLRGILEVTRTGIINTYFESGTY